MVRAALVLGLILVSAVSVHAQDGAADDDALPPPLGRPRELPPLQLGPLGVRGHSLFQLSTIDFTPDAPIAIPAGEFELHTALTWLNVFNYDSGAYLIDGEFVRASATLWYGLSDAWQAGVTLPIEYIGGGIMDEFIEGFHGFAGLDQGGRDEFDRDRFRIGVAGQDGILDWQSSDSGVQIGDITLSLRYRAMDPAPGRPGVSFGAKVKLPTSPESDFYETHHLGFGVDGNVYYPVDGWLFFAGFSAAMIGQAEVIGQRLEPFQMSFLAAVERTLTDDISIVVQLMSQSPIARSFHQFSSWSTEVSLGLKVRLEEHVTVQFAILENLFRFDNSADFGIHVGIVFRL